MNMLTIRNWDKWQSYRRDRQQPPWIKLHRELLRNTEWISLTDAQRAHLVSIWMLAADKNGRIPDDPRLVQKMCFLDNPPDLNLFIELGFIDARTTPRRRQRMTPERRQDDAPDKKIEADKEAEKKERGGASAPPPRARILPDDWHPNENHFALGRERGFTAAQVEDMGEQMRCWSVGKGEARKNWDMAFSGWIRREEPKNGRSRSTGPPVSEAYGERIRRIGEDMQREAEEREWPRN